MTKITCKSQLPAWFTPYRYLHIKKSPISAIRHELMARHLVWVGLYETPHEDLRLHFNDVCSELFTDRIVRSENSELAIDEDYNVVPMTNRDVIELAEITKQRMTKLNHGKNHSELELCTYKHSHYDLDKGNVLISLNLSKSTDLELISELKRLLPSIRQDLGIVKPIGYNSNEKHDNLFNCGVFEYLDLTMWAKANGYIIKPSFLSKVISSGKFTPKEINGKVKRNATDVMSKRYLEQLDVDIKNKKLK